MKARFKFRVWDKKCLNFWHKITGATAHGIILTSEGNPGIVCDLTTPYEPKSVNIFKKEYLCIQQFTGLEDKNGTEIYEGDIIDGGIVGYDYSKNRANAVVGFDTWGIYYTDVSKFNISEPYDNCISIAQEDSLIIGNIFENAELLK